VSGWWIASYVVLWCLVVALAVVVVALARQIGVLHMRLGPRGALEMDDEGPPLGEAPTPIDTVDIDGAQVSLGGPGRAQLLLFASPNCRVCEDVLPSLPAVAQVGQMEPFVVTDVDSAGARRLAESRGVPVVSSPEATHLYAVPGTPYAVVLDDLGVVRAKGTINNLEQMEGLVDTALRRLGTRRAS
jgi:methylamine dehydrogenase accessory protein MauD